MRGLTGILVGVALAVAAATSTAQQQSYDASALRVEDSHGDMRILRGSEGTVVARVGVFHSSDVVRLMASSERATFEARKFARDYKPGTLFFAIGIATLGAGLGVSQVGNGSHGIATALFVSGTGLVVYGAGRLEAAYNALARSLWWYNRDLTK
ncbi:MAG TPA: hypothetical protein VLJ83_01110 [Gemmatimonadaceae bacterium]|nr:hypothetical protein [Gemmatimonadaceae bacterium]